MERDAIIERALSIDGYMNNAELFWLYDRATLARTVVELGCYRGRSTFVLAAGVGAEGLVFTIDDFRRWKDTHPTDADMVLRNMGSLRARVRVVVADTHVADLPLPDGIDLLFMDAHSDYDGVSADHNRWVLHMNRGGIVAGHDYKMQEGVTRFVDELRALGSFVKTPVGGIWYYQC